MKQKFLHSALKIDSIFYRAKKLPKLLVNIFLIPILLIGFSIHANAQLAVHLSIINNVSCYGAANGEVEVLVTGATGAVTYSLDNGSYGPLNNPANSSFDGLGPGVHTICATDGNPIPVCQTITITQPNEIIITPNITQVYCPGNTGIINIEVAGGSVGPNPNAEYYLTTISNGVTTKDSFTTYYSGVPNYGTETFPGLAPGSYTITVEDNNYCHATFIGLINANTIFPAEAGGPVSTGSTVECIASASVPALASLPIITDYSNNPLTPVGPKQQLSFTNNFNSAATTSATAAPNVWYTDRYAPAGFASPVSFGADNRLKLSINAADGASSRPGGFGGAFYNTQGRGFDVGTATDAVEIQLYIPTSWSTTNKRMAGLWGVASHLADGALTYPIIEFSSDNNNPRFRVWEDFANGGNGAWVDIGLPSGFSYNNWYNLKIRLLPSGQFLMSAGSLNYITTSYAAFASNRIKSIILQGHNYDPAVAGAGVTYDIYWDNFTYNDAYATICEGNITYTYLYTDCGGLTTPWVYTYTVDRTTIPSEFGGPVSSSGSVQCSVDAIPPATLPVVKDICGTTLSYTGPLQQLSLTNNFNLAVTTSPTAAPNVWYTDRYAPAGFVSPESFSGGNRLKQSINAADGPSGRPGAFSTAFYNTQGRGFDVGAATDAVEIQLYVEAGWAATNKRMAGLWGVAVDATNTISGYPILEFNSDGNNPRFRAYDNGVWHDMGLPTGFAYDTWVTLKIRLLPSGQFLFSAGDKNYVSSEFTPPLSTRLKSVILQGHNYDPVISTAGVTYDIYWDNFTYNDANANVCEGTTTYTYLYTDCSGLSFPWVYTYTIDHVTPPAEFGPAASTSSFVQCWSDAVAPALPVFHDICGNTVNHTIGSPVISGTASNNSACDGSTVIYTYTYTDCSGLSTDWVYTYTLHHTNAPVVPVNASTNVQCLSDAVIPSNPGVNFIDQQQNVFNGWKFENNDAVGQSFTCGITGKLLQVEVNVYGGSGTFNLEIYSGNGINGTLLSTSPQSLSGTGWQTMTIPSNLAPLLVSGNQYTFYLNGYIYNTLFLSAANGNQYPGGVCYDSPPPSNYPDFDLMFRTHMGILDVCGNIIPTPTPVVSGTMLPCGGTKIYTYSYTDCASLTSNYVFTYNINNTTSPVITGAIAPSSVTGCSASNVPAPVTTVADLELLGLAISDDCTPDANLVVSSNDVPSGTCPIVVTRKYTVKDACNNPATYDQTISVTSPAVVFTCGNDKTENACQSQTAIQDSYDAWLLTTTASGGCNGSLTNNAPPSAPLACGGSVAVTWTYTSSCAPLTTTCTKTFTVTNAPSVNFTCATDHTEAACQTQGAISSAFSTWLGTTTANGGCNGSLVTVPASPSAPSACGGATTVTWNYTSNCGTMQTCTKTFTVTNSSAPTITCPINVTVNQHDSKDPWSTGYATSTNCSSPSVITYDDDRSHLNSCNATGYITRTWTATNSCGQSATCNQTITVNDVDNPIVTCPADITQSNDVDFCSAVVNFTSTALDFGYFQGFENTSWLSGTFPNAPSTDWNEYNSKVTQVASGTDGITSKTGAGHAVINSTILPASPNNTSGAFNRLGGYSSVYGSGLIAKTDVYFDVNDASSNPTTYGWDLSVAMSNQSGAHLRDFIYHVSGDNTGIYVGSDNSSSFTRQSPAYIISQPHASITASGWYTMEWETKNNAGNLAMDFNLRDASGAIVWTKTINTTDNIATTVGGNRYMWFTFIAANKLAIDNSGLQRKLSVTSSPASASIFNVGTTLVTSSATDACGHAGTCSFNVIVTDTQNPVISSCAVARTMDGCSTSAITGPAYNANVTASTYNEFHDATNQGVATDNCSITSVSYQDVITNASCPIIVKRTWTLKDAANNSASCDQIITVNSPTVNFTCAVDKTETSCQTQTDIQASYVTWLGTTTASGGCDGLLTNDAPTLAPLACGGFVDVTWTYTSSCAPLTTTCTKRFTVTNAPAVSFTCGTDVTLASCTNQATLNVAWANFLASTTASGGCNGILTNNAPLTPPSACGGSNTAVTWTYTSSCTTAVTCTKNFVVTAPGSTGVTVTARALLQGPYVLADTLMHDSLRVLGLVPTNEPYTSVPADGVVVEPGGESVSPAVLAITGPQAIVDWVYLELRAEATPSNILARKRALIRRDGQIVSNVDGVSPVYFPNVCQGNYYVVVKHRNHLAVMTQSAITLNGCSTPYFDFTSSAVYINPIIVNLPRKLIGSKNTLWSCDANHNKNIRYNGTSNDKDPILLVVGYSNPNNSISGYRSEDLNMDGKVRYNNTDNDRSLIINNVGISNPNTTLNQHTPN